MGKYENGLQDLNPKGTYQNEAMGLNSSNRIARIQGAAQSLSVNFSWTLIGNGVFAACQWAMLAAITKFGTSEMVGQFALGLALSAPIIMFGNLQLRALLATDARQEYQFIDYLALRLITTFVAILVIVGASVASGHRGVVLAVMVLLGLAKSLEALSDLFYGWFQKCERMDLISRRVIVKGLLGLVFLAALLILTDRILFAVIGLLVADMISLVAYDIRGGSFQKNTPENKMHFPQGLKGVLARRRIWIHLAWTALPLGFVMMLISLNANIPRYFLEHHHGRAELGVFAALAYLLAAGSMVISALGQSALPRLANYYERNDYRSFRRLLYKLLALAASLGCAMFLAMFVLGRPLLTLLYRPEYASRVDVLNWLMIVGTFQFIASFLGFAMTAARQFRVQIPLFILVAATSLVMSIMLIPKYGLTGATFALLGSGIVQLLGSAGIVFRALRLSKDCR